MIVLGRTKSLSFANTDIPERLVIDVVGTLSDNSLIPLHADVRQQALPNNGRVFIPNYFSVPEEHQYKLWELNESLTYEPSLANSSKYVLGKEVHNVPLYEVITLQGNFETQKNLIETKLRNSINSKETPLPNVLFTTEDGYVIGPVKIKHLVDEAYTLVEDNFVAVYKIDISLTMIHNRLFTIAKLLEDDFVGFIDVANDERAVRAALKILKEQYEYGDLSRKVIARLSQIYTSTSGEMNQRLTRVQQIIQSKTFNEETELFFRNQFLDLPYVQQMIEANKNDAFEKLLVDFKVKHRDLIKEVEITEHALENKNLELTHTEEVIQQKIALLQNIEESFSVKLTQLEKQFADVYVEHFLRQGINVQQQIPQTNHSQKVTEIPQACVKVITNNEPFASIDKTLEIFHTSRKRLHIRDRYETLHKTVLGAILFRDPVIIAGTHSFELAQFIGRTYSANQFYSIVPEVNLFSFAALENLTPHAEDILSAVHIHNLHFTQGEFALKSYVELMKWNDKATQLLILTFDDVQQAKTCITSLSCTPLLYAEDFLNFAVLPRKFITVNFAQIDLSEVEDLELEDCSTFNREFEAWFEEKFGYKFEQSFVLDNWLSILTSDLDGSNESELEHIYKLFEHYITSLKRDGKS
ncbi:hypothetical protein [Neobacillus massiliamazoniensis]|uniref:Uncharacterized protein n=1 Tax=Neobacillus massiliamazoniensis TaxID=1499688 RepID=A0A0U1NYA8_9BACI|nr:hypothetical protein [Neobacillus massiliamazoniensis]CRK83010.1 hypothetical protein BN000_02965 [Neobacillus massiliamazoniensis]